MIGKTQVAINAHLLSGQAGYRSAGIHGYIFNTLAHLASLDSDFSYSLYLGNGHVPDNIDWRVIRSRLNTHNPVNRILWEQLQAPVELHRTNPSLFHGMGFSLPLVWSGPSVVTIYDLSFMRYPEKLPKSRQFYLTAITRRAAQKAARVITISESGKSEISELLQINPDIIDVAYPGVGPEYKPENDELVQAFRKSENLPEKFILHVGTIEPRKNLEVLIRAYSRLPQRHDVKLVLAGGKGWSTDPIFRLINDLHLEDNVILPGYIEGNMLPMWYNAALITVYPSVYEGFGMPPAESMACGTPVVVSNATSLPEVVGAEGFSLSPFDIEAWTETMAMLIENKQKRQKLAEYGIKYVKRFNWAETARATLTSYRRALEPES